VDREYRVLCALAESEVPVPKAIHLCEDRAIIGSMFYLMSFEPGRIFWDHALPELAVADRKAVYEEMVSVLANLHNVEPAEVGLADYGRPGNYYARQVNTWTMQYRASATEENRTIDSVIEWLVAHVPPDSGRASLIHGDFRLDNLIYHPNCRQVKAVLDWELSTLGDPIADLAYLCVFPRLPANKQFRGLAGKSRMELGIPTESQVVEMYCARRGISEIEQWNFYLTFSFFRVAAIVQGVYKRALNGNAANANALELGATVAILGHLAAEAITG